MWIDTKKTCKDLKWAIDHCPCRKITTFIKILLENIVSYLNIVY